MWIFIGSYVVVGFLVFLFMAKRMAHSADHMREMGMDQQHIDSFYRSMGAPTLATLIWSTLLTGSIVGGIASGIYWLLS